MHTDIGQITYHISGIYLITNLVNTHKYIGKAKDIKHRWIEHCSNAKLNKKSPLYDAMRKYGISNFQFTILETMTLEEYNQISNERERFYIEKFNTYNDKQHYNLTPGGDSGMVGLSRSEKEKEKISDGLKKFYQTEEGKQKRIQQSEMMKNNKNSSGHRHSEEWKKQHSERMSSSNNPHYETHIGGCKVLCIETEVIYPSIRAAASAVGISHSCINAVLQERQKTAGGYHWKRVK